MMTEKQEKYFESILSMLKRHDPESYEKALAAERDDKAFCIEVAKKISGLMGYEQNGKGHEITGVYFTNIGERRLEKKIRQYAEWGEELPEEYVIEIKAREIIKTFSSYEKV